MQELEKAFKYKYSSLGIALLKIFANLKGAIEDIHVQESLLATLLQTTECNLKTSEKTSSGTSSGSVLLLPPPVPNSTVDVFAMIRDSLNESSIWNRAECIAQFEDSSK